MLTLNRFTLLTVSSVMILSTGYAYAETYDDGMRQINQVMWDKSDDVPYQAIGEWTIPENQTNLIFVRAESSDDAQSSANIGIDGRFHVSLQDGHYSQVLQCAGTHRLSIDTTGRKSNDLEESDKIVDLKPQTTHYFYVEVDEATGEATLTEVNEENGLGLLYNKFRQTHQVSRTKADCASRQILPDAVQVDYVAPENVAPEYIDVAKPSEVLPVIPVVIPAVVPSVTPVNPVKQPNEPITPTVSEPAATQNDVNDIIVINKPIKLGVLFDTNSANIRPVYNKLVEDVADFMEKYPTTRTLIEGHTDSVGSASYNMALSQRRAESVKSILVNIHGANPNRLKTIGYGETQPIEDNSTPEGRQINRRVVATITPE